MPKLKCSDIVRLRGFVKEFGEKYFTTDEIILFCKLCEVKVTAEKHFTVQQHCNTGKYKSCANTEFAAESKQRLLFEESHSSSSILSSAYGFSKNLCKIMVSSNISLHKVEAARFRKLLEKYTTHPILCGFCGLVVGMLTSGTQDRGFEPSQSRRIFRAKKSTACLP
jgi:hypothetical protein